MAVIQSSGRRRVVVDASRQAQLRGVKRGMSEAEARALTPALICIEQDIAGDRRALRGAWTMDDPFHADRRADGTRMMKINQPSYFLI